MSSAPGIFQRVMENVLQGTSQVMVYIDDILVAGRDETEHLSVYKDWNSLDFVCHRGNDVAAQPLCHRLMLR